LCGGGAPVWGGGGGGGGGARGGAGLKPLRNVGRDISCLRRGRHQGLVGEGVGH
jgi:hypothetical protein